MTLPADAGARLLLENLTAFAKTQADLLDDVARELTRVACGLTVTPPAAAALCARVDAAHTWIRNFYMSCVLCASESRVDEPPGRM